MELDIIVNPKTTDDGQAVVQVRGAEITLSSLIHSIFHSSKLLRERLLSISRTVTVSMCLAVASSL